MKNQAEFPKAKELAQTLLDVFATLSGNSKSMDPMLEGEHDVVVVKAEERLSAKGKEMKEIVFRDVTNGRDVTQYVMKFKEYDWNKWKSTSVGDELRIRLKYNNGFANITKLAQFGKREAIQKPSEALTNQTIWLFDIEVFKKDNLFVFRDYFTKEWVVINNDLEALRKFYLDNRDSLFIGYNNVSYDNNVMRATLQGKNPYPVSKAIITCDDRSIQYKMFDTKKTPIFSMDLYQDNKGFSLKEHSAFLGINIKETEVDFDMDRELINWREVMKEYNLSEEMDELTLTDELARVTGINVDIVYNLVMEDALIDEKIKNILYCKNDVLATELRFEQNISMLLAKVVLCAMYDLDKSAVAFTNANLTATILGAVKHEDRGDERSYYEMPSGFIVENETVLENMTGDLPDKIEFTVNRRDVDVAMGEGGSHSAKVSYINVTDEMWHNDAESLHPSSMILFNYESRNIPEAFQGRFAKIKQERIKAKHNKHMMLDINGVAVPGWVLDMGYKLPLNGTYGAEGAEFNKLYDPRMRLLVCLVGQLAFFDLLEKLEPHGTVIQTNTDAIDLTPFSDEDWEECKKIMKDWEERTGYSMESEKYVEIFQKDVNNYVQVMADGSVNVKGAVGLSKGLKNSKAVVSNAFINYLLAGKDYKEFINECQDLRQFQIITKTGHTFDETVVIDKDGNESKAQKVNRVFAVKDPEKAVEIYKVKNLDNEIKDLTIIE